MPVNTKEVYTIRAEEIRSQLGETHEKLAAFFDDLAETTDFDALHALEEKHIKVNEAQLRDPMFPWSSHQEKFLVMAEWFIRKYRLIQSLRIDEMAPIRLLDIGSGGGHFLALARFFGHDIHGLDIPDPVFDDICAFQEIPRTLHEITAGEKLPDMGPRFDFVTAQLINFNTLPDRDWNAEEWAFFLNDLTGNHMNEQGNILLQFNMRQFQEGGLNVEDDSMAGFVRSLGGQYLEDNSNNEITYYALFSKLPQLRQKLMMYG